MRRLPAGNLVFSPDSVDVALAMTGSGASGETALQIARALRLGTPARFPAVGQLQGAIAAEQSAAGASLEAPLLNIANGLFIQQGFPIQAPFTEELSQSFGASPQVTDFMTPAALEAINSWASQQTHGLIPHVIEELSPDTRLALANAVYLKAVWEEKFEVSGTRPAPFHAEHATSSADFMHETASLSYAAGRGYAALSLPYRDSTLSLLVLLPRHQSLRRLEARLDVHALDRVLASLEPRAVVVSLPRFHLKTSAMLEGPLRKLGITDAFVEGKADFSRIAQAEDLAIGEVVHAADFKVDEAGTEAAAVTVVGIEATSAHIYRHPVEFNADHPFLFFLRDDRTGALLFAGRLLTPQE